MHRSGDDKSQMGRDQCSALRRRLRCRFDFRIHALTIDSPAQWFAGALRTVRAISLPGSGEARVSARTATRVPWISGATGIEIQTATALAFAVARSASAIGLKPILPRVPSRRGAASQQRRERCMHHHHDPDLCNEPPRARQVPIVHSPENLQPGVDSFHAPSVPYTSAQISWLLAAGPGTAAGRAHGVPAQFCRMTCPHCRSSTWGSPSPRAWPDSGTSTSDARAQSQCRTSCAAWVFRSLYHNNILCLLRRRRCSRSHHGQAATVPARCSKAIASG